MIRCPGRPAALLLATTLTLAGCGALHGGVTAEANECALTLPVAEQVVGHQGKLLLIRPIGRQEAELVAQNATSFATSTTGAAANPRSTLCVAVFRGPFAADTVQGVEFGGEYAIVLADVRHQQVVATFVTDRLPRSLCMRHEECATTG